MSKQTPEQHYEIWESFMLKVFEHLKTPPSNYEEFYKTVSKDYFLMTVEDHASLLAEVERLKAERDEWKNFWHAHQSDTAQLGMRINELQSLNKELVEALKSAKDALEFEDESGYEDSIKNFRKLISRAGKTNS